MKKTIMALLTVTMLALLALPVAVTTGCKSPNGTNAPTTLDPAKVQQIADAVEPVMTVALRRAIANSPQHSAEIGNYARALGTVACDMQSGNNFSPSYLVDAVNKATAGLQAGVDPIILDVKDVIVAIYKIAYNDRMTWSLGTNIWPKAVCGAICDSVNQALLDSGLPGCKPPGAKSALIFRKHP
jgi:hypothetical protein